MILMIVLVILAGAGMSYRNTWLCMEIIWLNGVDPERFNTLPSYNAMMLMVWIWDIDKF